VSPAARIAAYVFSAVVACVALFQLALALGMPWGAFAMGGAFPGQYPPAMRVAAIVQMALLGLQAAVVLSAAGIVLPAWQRVRWPIWLLVGFAAAGVVLNLITPSAGERLIWAPVAMALFVASLVVALATRPARR
jgi:hypothetical protein